MLPNQGTTRSAPDVSLNSVGASESLSLTEERATEVAPVIPSSTRPQLPVEANPTPVVPPPSDFYTDLDVLLSRLETQEVGNYEVRSSPLRSRAGD